MSSLRTDYAPTMLVGPDPVSAISIRMFCEAIGDANPIYVDEAVARAHGHPGQVVPPSLLNSWTMPPLALRGDGTARPNPSELARATIVERVREDLIQAGYDAVVATNYEHEYQRYLVVGDRITEHSSLESISEPKQTRLGLGRFVTTLHQFNDASGELVGTQRMRIFVFPRSEPTDIHSRAEQRAHHTQTELEPHGDADWPALEVPVTATMIACGAIGGNDFNPVHHDKAFAQSQGLPSTIMNILTSSGLAVRCVTDHLGPATRVRALRVRLGVPNHPGDRLVLTAAVRPDGPDDGRAIEVVGTNARGAHITATVTVEA
jgi:acyl dehydratase